jgi:hypothetical protein
MINSTTAIRELVNCRDMKFRARQSTMALNIFRASEHFRSGQYRKEGAKNPNPVSELYGHVNWRSWGVGLGEGSEGKTSNW